MTTSTFDCAWHGGVRLPLDAGASRSFRRWGAIGLACGAAFALLAARPLGLSLASTGLAVLAGIGGAAASAWLASIASGRERLVYYREAGAALAAVACVAMLTGEPLARCLDVAIVSLALVGAFGRLGCLAAGCCHGRPAAFGVVYGIGHVAEGFPACHAGARLWPVQAAEAALQALLACAGAALLASGSAPGTTAASCTLLYASGRLVLEHWRGDDRPYWGPLSAAQWTSVALAAAILALQAHGAVASVAWHRWFGLGLGGVGFALLVPGFVPGARRRRLLRGDHVAELAALAMRTAEETPAVARLARTSAGLRVSGAVTGSGMRAVLHFTFSDPPHGLDERTAQALADPLLRILAPGGTAQLVCRPGGIAHLIVPRRPAAFAHGRARGVGLPAAAAEGDGRGDRSAVDAAQCRAAASPFGMPGARGRVASPDGPSASLADTG